MRTPESFEKDEIKKYLKRIQAYYIVTFSMGFGKSGTSDIIGCYKGSFFSIEVKRENKEPTPLQVKRMAEVRSAGGIAFYGTAKKVISEMEECRRRGLL